MIKRILLCLLLLSLFAASVENVLRDPASGVASLVVLAVVVYVVARAWPNIRRDLSRLPLHGGRSGRPRRGDAGVF